ncbi:hypothetical protein OIO90_003329 [Microbotryomycetes sp. JL221]|nr:hypothetical protein OIO90_003329 [Microbotryomycetes sp. JL221]
MASTSAAPTTTTTTSTTTTSSAPKKELPHLLPLEEDDEFEEFAAEDWDDSETFGATLTKSKSTNNSGTNSSNTTNNNKGLDSLWEDNWDDDDIGDDFSVQLSLVMSSDDHPIALVGLIPEDERRLRLTS